MLPYHAGRGGMEAWDQYYRPKPIDPEPKIYIYTTLSYLMMNMTTDSNRLATKNSQYSKEKLVNNRFTAALKGIWNEMHKNCFF